MTRFLLTLSIAALLAPAAAMADPPHGRGHDKHGRHDKHDKHEKYDRYDERARGNGPGHDNGRHLGQKKQAWRRGERAPSMYLEQRYYVDNYGAYDLAAPPRGHRWVRPADNEYLLVEVATGLIAQVLGN